MEDFSDLSESETEYTSDETWSPLQESSNDTDDNVNNILEELEELLLLIVLLVSLIGRIVLLLLLPFEDVLVLKSVSLIGVIVLLLLLEPFTSLIGVLQGSDFTVQPVGQL